MNNVEWGTFMIVVVVVIGMTFLELRVSKKSSVRFQNWNIFQKCQQSAVTYQKCQQSTAILQNVNKQLSFFKNDNNQLSLFKNVNKQLDVSVISNNSREVLAT